MVQKMRTKMMLFHKYLVYRAIFSNNNNLYIESSLKCFIGHIKPRALCTDLVYPSTNPIFCRYSYSDRICLLIFIFRSKKNICLQYFLSHNVPPRSLKWDRIFVRNSFYPIISPCDHPSWTGNITQNIGRHVILGIQTKSS
jgi:hypothetical protein